MSAIVYQGRRIVRNESETVLDALLREGNDVAHSCRRGVCRACLLRAESGEIPAESQEGLRETERAAGWFHACRSRPEGELVIADASSRHEGVVTEITPLGAGVVRLLVEPREDFEYRAGQFVTLHRSDGLARSYSVASLPEDGRLEFHVRRIPGGRMSSWIHDDLRVGETLEYAGPFGSCFYVEDARSKPLLLAGAGTGLAPLLGIVRDALRREHAGSIRLYHGALRPESLYHVRELRSLAAASAGIVEYVPCALEPGEEPSYDVRIGAIGDAIVEDLGAELAASRIYLCGDPGLVTSLRKQLFLAGASAREIHADPFVTSGDSGTCD